MAQTQTPNIVRKSWHVRDYFPAADVYAGDVVVIGQNVYVSPCDIGYSASVGLGLQGTPLQGGIVCQGIIGGNKDTSTFSDGDAVYWNATGNPVVGTAGTGCFTSTASGNKLAGQACAAAATGDQFVDLMLNPSKNTATTAGSMTADDITGSDSSLGIVGAPAATVTSAGGAVVIAGAAGGATSGTGGTATIAGGAGTAGNSAGGVSSVTGGAGQGSAAGGVGKVVGGVGGATGAGGAAQVTGGAGGATSGTGGAVVIAAGAGSGGNANGGDVTINAGAKNGSGADGAITIGSTAASITLGKMPRIPTATVAAAGTVQGDAAAITEGFTLVTGSTNAGVILPSAVAGMQVIIKNNVGGNMKVWPNTSDAINAGGANNAYTMATLTSALFVAYDATTWYTVPLLAS
jgi:hypothetical protein